MSFGSVAEALRAGSAFAEYLNSPAAALVDARGCGEVLAALGGIESRLAAARALLLRRFDAASAHDADGYGSSSAWLAAMTRMSKRDARAAVAEMRQHARHPHLAAAQGRGDLSRSWAGEIAGWLRKLPGQLRPGTEKILADAAAAGASLEDLAAITAHALARWQADNPDPDDDGGFGDRYLTVGTTFGGAGVIRGDLTPECAAAVTAVLQALGKPGGPEDDRTEPQRFHDALQLACELLLRARLVPDRAGADTQVTATVPLSHLREMPGAAGLEDAWIRALLGEDGHLAGTGAQAAACDAQAAPAVTGTMDMTVVDQMIDLVLGTYAHGSPAPGAPAPSPAARQNLRHAIARLAADLLSGPAGLAAALRTGLLPHPWNTPSLPLDIGSSHTIPAHIRRAVRLRDRHCAWPHCTRPAAWCDVHHITHKADGGETSLANSILLCQYHHDTCIHRHGWTITLHPDGTTTAHGPRGQTLHSHTPPRHPPPRPG